MQIDGVARLALMSYYDQSTKKMSECTRTAQIMANLICQNGYNEYRLSFKYKISAHVRKINSKIPCRKHQRF
jgi:hypothetical protein